MNKHLLNYYYKKKSNNNNNNNKNNKKKVIKKIIKKASERATMTEIQKICMLGSARILRKVLSV